ncbi:MAG: hypothetical protein AAFX87_29225 [Bacteroidota bacterium]
MKTLILLMSMLFCLPLGMKAQSNQLKQFTVNLKERQNRAAAKIPGILLKAYAKGDIKAYYPRDTKREAPFRQFLNHFGMASKAYASLSSDQPFWFCRERSFIEVDPDVTDCMSYRFELVEQSYKDPITYEQKTRMLYIRLIYSSECSLSGIDKEGPIFKIGDIKKLKKSSEYAVPNYQNAAVTYTVSDFLTLRLFSAEKVRR